MKGITLVVMPMIDIQDGNDCFTNDEEGFVDNVEAAYSGAMSEILDNHKDKMKRHQINSKIESQRRHSGDVWPSRCDNGDGGVRMETCVTVVMSSRADAVTLTETATASRAARQRRIGEWKHGVLVLDKLRYRVCLRRPVDSGSCVML
ncbi:hypothetical protein E3N88_31893 [Mikania micrantha]|uniref:Uncharacterized protein n=1 Tax=Mikania micrantha TaxID=192012 RepID=A0A5N6M6X3_9ASTR|nr:hypothetical protein E3N88_31893 [Mikania micrantha]